MNAARLSLALGLLFGGVASAQVDVVVLMEQQQFLPGESIPIKVRVVNHSGRPLQLGGDTSWLQLSVEAEQSLVIPRTQDLPLTPRFELPPSKMATRELDLTLSYRIVRPGRYSVTASVTISEWNQTHVSRPTSFDVIRGTKVWERAFGVPGVQRADGSPEVRKYILQQANYLRGHLRLYARITDLTEEQTFKVVVVGPMISFAHPEGVLDQASRLHVLYQSGPRTSTYCVIDPAGEVLRRDPIEYGPSRPRLIAADDGSVTVRGGVLAAPPPEASAPQPTASESKD
jgi:hypothetical protein